MRVKYTRRVDGKILKPKISVDMEKMDAEHYIQVLKEHLKEDLIKVELLKQSY
jgi:hypothetical protein